MGGSTNSLDSLSSPSPSPPPSLNKGEGSVSTSASTKRKSAEPAAGLDSDSELSELTEEEQDEKQKHKQKQKKSEINSLSPGASRSSFSNRRGTAPAVRGGSRRGGRKKRSTFVPAPMWGWAMYGAEHDIEKSNGVGEENENENENEGNDEKESVHISSNHISAPNPLDVLTSAALNAENSRPSLSRLKSDSQETEEEEGNSINVYKAKDVTNVVDGDIDMVEPVSINHTTVIANGPSSIASSRAPTPDSIASSRPSPPKDVLPAAYVSMSGPLAGASTTEDEDDNTEIEEDEMEPDEQSKAPTTTKSRSKPNLRIDASAQLPPNLQSNPPKSHSSSPRSPVPSAASVKSPITPSTNTVTATNSKAKASRGGRGRGRGRGRARTRGVRVNTTTDADRPFAAEIIDDQNGISSVTANLGKENAIDIEADGIDIAPARNPKTKLSKVADSEDEIMEPEDMSLMDTNKTIADIDADCSDKSDAEPEPEVEVDVDPEVEADVPSDISEGEDEKEDEGEGEDEKDDADELGIDEEKEDEDKEDEDKDDEDKDDDDKEDAEKDIDDDDRSEMNLEEEEESDLQPAHRVEALDMLAVIELKFALLREKLYIEKMEELAWEESLVSSGQHPELIHIQNELLLRKTKRLELAERKCTFEVANITKRRRLDEDATWSSWKLQRDELQTDMIAENNRKRRKLERERRAVDRPQSARRMPHPPIPEFLPPAPTLRQVVDSFSFTNSDQIIRNLNSSRKMQGGKPQVNDSHRSQIRGINGINEQATLGSTVAYPKLSTLSSSEAQEDLEALLSVTGARRAVPGPALMNTMGMVMNMNMGNMGMSMDMNMNPMYEQGIHGPPTDLGPSHVPLGNVYIPVLGTPNGLNSNRDRLGQGSSSSLNHGPGLARRMVSGPIASSGSLGPTQSSLSMGHAHESQFAVGGLPPPPIGGGGGSNESQAPLFGPNRPVGVSGPRPESSAGLRSGSTGGGRERERELRSVPTGGGGRSAFHHEQFNHSLSGPPINTNGALLEHERQRDGDITMASSVHGRQVSSSTHFAPPAPGGGGVPPTSGSRNRSLSPVGPSVGIGTNGPKGNGQWMGPGMGMGAFGTGHTGHRREEEERERERERMGHRDVRDVRERERDRDRDRDREKDQHVAIQQRHIQQDQQHARPQSAGPTTGGPSAPSHAHPHPNQALHHHHHHHHVRPHHHHIVHHHHGPSTGSSNTSPTSVRGPSLSPRTTRVEVFAERERDIGNGPSPRTPVHPHPPTEVINLTSKSNVVGPSAALNRHPDDLPLEYRERERDGRRLSGGRPSSGPGSRILDERERDRDRDGRDRVSNMPFILGSHSQGQQLNGIPTSSISSSRPSSWNAIDRDDPYRPEPIHSSTARRPPSSNASLSSPIQPRGSILSPPSSTSAFVPSSTISPPRTRTLPPRAASPAVGSLIGAGPSGPVESRMRSPPRNRERSPLTTSQNQTNSNHNSSTKFAQGSPLPSSTALAPPAANPTNSRMPLSIKSLPISTPAVASNPVPEDISKNGSIKNVGATVPPLPSLSPKSIISSRTIDASLTPLLQKRDGVLEDGQP